MGWLICVGNYVDKYVGYCSIDISVDKYVDIETILDSTLSISILYLLIFLLLNLSHEVGGRCRAVEHMTLGSNPAERTLGQR